MNGNLAGWWRRLLQYLIDGLIVGIVGRFVFGGSEFFEVLLSAAYWIFFIGYDRHATLAMRLLRIHVVPSDGRPEVTYADAAIRFLMMLVSAIPLGLGFLWAAWDHRRRGWHDMVARTLVVND